MVFIATIILKILQPLFKAPLLAALIIVVLSLILGILTGQIWLISGIGLISFILILIIPKF